MSQHPDTNQAPQPHTEAMETKVQTLSHDSGQLRSRYHSFRPSSFISRLECRRAAHTQWAAVEGSSTTSHINLTEKKSLFPWTCCPTSGCSGRWSSADWGGGGNKGRTDSLVATDEELKSLCRPEETAVCFMGRGAQDLTFYSADEKQDLIKVSQFLQFKLMGSVCCLKMHHVCI